MSAVLQILIALLDIALILLAAMAFFTWRTAKRVESAMPPRGRFVDLPGVRLHVREFGEDKGGLPLLLVHGLAGQMGHYTYGVAECLGEKHRVIVVDRPGSGYSTRADGAATDIAAQAATLAALLDKMGVPKVMVVGHSLGGAIGLALALNHRERIAGLALLAPLTGLPKEASPAFRALMIPSAFVRKLVGWTLAVPMTIRRSTEVLDIVFGPEAVPADYATKGGGYLSLRPQQFISASADFMAIPAAMGALVPRYGELGVPVHILYGTSDRILDWRENGEAFVARVPGARLVTLEGGHMLPVTQPQACVDFIEDSVARLG